MADHLLVSNDFPPKTGGIQVYLYELWRRLEPGRAVVLSASSHPDAASFDRDCAMVVERVDSRTLFWPSRRNRRLIEDAVARHQVKLVLLDPAWPLGLLGPKLSVPYGVVLHGAEVAIPGRLPLVRSTLRRVLRHAVVAVCAGGYPEAEARRVAGAAMPPVIQIPPGVDTDRFVPLAPAERDVAREDFDFSATAKVVVSYSRLVPRKGMDTLIAASAELRTRFPDLVVAIGGSGRDRRRLENLATKLAAPVRFFGRVSDEDLPRFVAAADAMVMDCRTRWAGFEQEGFGIVFVEASSCAVAPVAGRSGGSHEAVLDGRTGVVVNDPRSSSQLAEALGALLDDEPRREQLALAAREYAVANFDWRVLSAALGRQLARFDG